MVAASDRPAPVGDDGPGLAGESGSLNVGREKRDDAAPGGALPAAPDAARSEPTAAARAERPDPAPSQHQAILQLVTSVVAPTTLLTALLYYFGWVRTNALFQHFGVDATLLRLSTTDYVLRSVEATYVPLGVLFVASLCAVSAHRLVLATMSAGRAGRALRGFAWATALTGAALLVRGLAGIASPAVSQRDFLVTPLCLGAGTLLATYGGWLLTRLHGLRQRWPDTGRQRSLVDPVQVLVGLIVVLSLFWAATEYAQAVGRTLAGVYGADVSSRPEAVLYSKSPLFLQPPVRSEGLPPSAGADGFRYRYTGLRLLTESAGRLFLVPQGWAQTKATIVLDESESIRIELHPGSGFWR